MSARRRSYWSPTRAGPSFSGGTGCRAVRPPPRVVLLFPVIARHVIASTHRSAPLPPVGDHGYDNSLTSMHPFMAAVGPGFRQGYRISSMQSVDIYPLMCHLLAVPPQPNNGTLNQARLLLATDTYWEAPVVVGMVVGVLLVLTTITGESERPRRI